MAINQLLQRVWWLMVNKINCLRITQEFFGGLLISQATLYNSNQAFTKSVFNIELQETWCELPNMIGTEITF